MADMPQRSPWRVRVAAIRRLVGSWLRMPWVWMLVVYASWSTGTVIRGVWGQEPERTSRCRGLVISSWGATAQNPQACRTHFHPRSTTPNLGDITTIEWPHVPPVEVLCGGFSYRHVSTVDKWACLAPGWSHLAATIEVLRPRLVVIENTCGLLSTSQTHVRAVGNHNDHRNPDDLTSDPEPFATWSRTMGSGGQRKSTSPGCRRSPCSAERRTTTS